MLLYSGTRLGCINHWFLVSVATGAELDSCCSLGREDGLGDWGVCPKTGRSGSGRDKPEIGGLHCLYNLIKIQNNTVFVRSS